MTIAIIFSAVLFFAIWAGAFLLILAYWPKETYVNDRNELTMKTVIGKPHIVPLADTTECEMTDSLMKPLIRTNGLSLGKYHTGHFKNLKTKQKLYLFLTGKPETRCFRYHDRIYVVDDWE